MAPPFVPEDEELLLVTRNTIKNHPKGTWENTTKLYNILVPSHVQRTQDSLQNRYKIMNVEQAQRRAQGNSKSALEDKVLRTFHKMLNVSMYATEYPDLAIRKSSGIRARTQTAGGRSKNGRDGRNTSIRSAEPHQTRSKVNTCFTHPSNTFIEICSGPIVIEGQPYQLPAKGEDANGFTNGFAPIWKC